MSKQMPGGSGVGCSAWLGDAANALIGQCDICGNITAIDLDATRENAKAMQHQDRTVRVATKEEALALWRTNRRRCNHKALIASLRAAASPNAGAQARQREALTSAGVTGWAGKENDQCP